MTPSQYEKIKRIADDERGDPTTRAAAQKQVEKWRVKMEVPLGRHKSPLHPGRRQSPEYEAWAKNMEVGNRERK